MSVPRNLRYAGIGAAIVIAAFAFRPLWQSTPGKAPGPASAPAPATEAWQLARRAIATVTKLSFTRTDLATAAALARQATEIAPSQAFGWGTRARVEAMWLYRNWDFSEARQQALQEYASRAIALDPGEPNALFSQAVVLRHQRALPEAAALLQRALKTAPDDNYPRRALATVYQLQGRTDEAIATYKDALRRDPEDPLTHVAVAVIHANVARVKDNDPANVDIALAHVDRSLKIRPYGTALVWKAAYQASYKGDVEGARSTLARATHLSPEEMADDRMVYFQMWIALLDQKPERALEWAALTSSTYFSDTLVTGPMAWMKAFAHRQARRESAATEEWRAAEKLLRARLAANPEAVPTQGELAVTLAMLGRKDEAAKHFSRYDAAIREPGRPATLTHVRYYAALGDAKRVAAAVREARQTAALWLTPPVLARDPWFDGVWGKPEFQALEKGPGS